MENLNKFEDALNKVLTEEIGSGIIQDFWKDICIRYATIGYEIAKKTDDWIEYDFKIIKSRPKEYGRYWIYRKNGKQHYEIWNGNGWAYNNNDITHYMKLPNNPIKKQS